MNDANSLRSILLVKNVEEQDPDGSVLPLAERDAATRDALRRHPAGNGDRAVHAWQVLATRADSLRAKLAERHPVVTRAVGLESQLAGVGGLVLLAAFGLGVALSLLDSRVRIEILAFPLLGVVLWNLVVYAVLAVSSLRREPAPSAGSTALLPGWTLWPARWTWQRAAKLIKQSSFYHRPLSAALRRFSDEWWPIAQPLLVWQGKRLFHFGSAVVALGLIAGFYLRGIALEYRAGWESTFLGTAQVRALLGLIYGPASVATGIELPADDTAVASLHWRNGAGRRSRGAVDSSHGRHGHSLRRRASLAAGADGDAAPGACQQTTGGAGIVAALCATHPRCQRCRLTRANGAADVLRLPACRRFGARRATCVACGIRRGYPHRIRACGCVRRRRSLQHARQRCRE